MKIGSAPRDQLLPTAEPIAENKCRLWALNGEEGAMILYWTIRYLDSTAKKLKDRVLYLNTSTLDPTKRSSVELAYRLGGNKPSASMLRFRDLFRELDCSIEQLVQMADDGEVGSVNDPHDYVEDENGKQILHSYAMSVITGKPGLVAIPLGADQHDIDFIMSDQKPIPLDRLTISDSDLESLAYFVRDLRELEKSSIMAEGPGKLFGVMGSTAPSLQTAITEEQIGAFVTIFRRLYMNDEPHNFVKSVNLFAKIAGDYPIVEWVRAGKKLYQAKLRHRPDTLPFLEQDKWSFSRQDLIDVFIYTRYAHQPNEQKKTLYEKYLNEVGGNTGLLSFLFLTEIWQMAICIINAGRPIAKFFDKYCALKGITPNILDSLGKENPGVGSLETKDAERKRIIAEQTERLAKHLWEAKGCPAGGFERFLEEARKTLDGSAESGDPTVK